MKRLMRDDERDNEGRLVIRAGGACPVCGNGPDIKFAGNGTAVLYHTPTECARHVANWRAKSMLEKDRDYAEVYRGD